MYQENIQIFQNGKFPEIKKERKSNRIQKNTIKTFHLVGLNRPIESLESRLWRERKKKMALKLKSNSAILLYSSSG